MSKKQQISGYFSKEEVASFTQKQMDKFSEQMIKSIEDMINEREANGVFEQAPSVEKQPEEINPGQQTEGSLVDNKVNELFGQIKEGIDAKINAYVSDASKNVSKEIEAKGVENYNNDIIGDINKGNGGIV